MNWDQIEGKWKQLKGSVKQEFGNLTDNDLEMIAGSRDKFIGKLQERYGYNREEAQRKADVWLQKAASTGAYAHSQSGSQHETHQHAGKH